MFDGMGGRVPLGETNSWIPCWGDMMILVDWSDGW